MRLLFLALILSSCSVAYRVEKVNMDNGYVDHRLYKNEYWVATSTAKGELPDSTVINDYEFLTNGKKRRIK